MMRFFRGRFSGRDAFVAALLLCGALWLFPAACERASKEKPPPPVSKPVDLTIAFTGNIYGLIDPCGCVKKQLGGLARRATLLRQIGEKARNLVYVDYGAMLFPKAPLTEIEREQRVAKARLLVSTADELGLRAYTPGGSDLSGGAALLRELLKDAPFEVVSANLYDPATHEPLFATHAVLNVGGLRLGVTGVSEDVLAERPELKDTLEIREPMAALQEALAALRPVSDRILVLSRLGGEARMEISTFEGVDFVLGWPEEPGASHARSANRAVIGAVSDQGQRVGVIEAHLVPGLQGYVRRAEFEVAKAAAERARAQAALPQVKENPEALAVARQTVSDTQAKLDELSKRNPYEGAVFEVSDELEPLSEVFVLVDDFRRTQERSAVQTYGHNWEEFLKDQNRYAGAQSCRTCHQVQYDHWLETRHAHAFATLEKTHQSADQSCIRCHSTAYASIGGFQGGFVPKLFQNVQCESCHGPSAGHVRTPTEVLPPWKVNETRCRTCHGTMHGEEFDYAEMLPKAASPLTGFKERRLESEALRNTQAP